MDSNRQDVFHLFAAVGSVAPAASGGTPASPIRRALADFALINLCVFALVAYSLYQSREESRQPADAITQTLSRLLAQDDAGNFGRIDMRCEDKLFQVFGRMHPVGQFEGSATGLATVKRIVGRHGGRVWVDGRVDAGATFSFSLVAHEVGHDTDE